MDSPPHPDDSSSTPPTPTTTATSSTNRAPKPPQWAQLGAELWALLWPAVWSQLRSVLLPWLRPRTWSQVWHDVWPVEKSPAYLRRALPQILPVLLLFVLVTSLISMLAFVASIVLGVLPGNEGNMPVTGLYAIGLFGLLVATVGQMLGVGILICLWVLRVDADKKPQELALLIVSLVPYLSVVVFLATLVIYVRERERSDDPLTTSLQGTFSDAIDLTYTFSGPCTDASGATGTVTETVNMLGVVWSADSLSGTYTTDVSWTVSLNGQPTTSTRHQVGSWTAARNG